MPVNYRLVATQVGDHLKYATTINEIDRYATSIFRFRCDSFPNDAITSARAQRIHDWILTLARQPMAAPDRDELLIQFCRGLGPGVRESIDAILVEAGLPRTNLSRENRDVFTARDLHAEVVKHSRKLFEQENYFHAVFEAAKVYNKQVRDKARSAKDGQALMLEVWGWEKGCLKVTQCKTDTDKNVQDGIKFLSAGLMQAIRNPTAHEPAVDWPISQKDCLDVLSFLSFLFRQLDAATYFQSGKSAE